MGQNFGRGGKLLALSVSRGEDPLGSSWQLCYLASVLVSVPSPSMQPLAPIAPAEQQNKTLDMSKRQLFFGCCDSNPTTNVEYSDVTILYTNAHYSNKKWVLFLSATTLPSCFGVCMCKKPQMKNCTHLFPCTESFIFDKCGRLWRRQRSCDAN